MLSSIPTVVPMLLLLFGAGALYQSTKSYRQYRAVAGLTPEPALASDGGESTAVRGPVDLEEPASLERAPPEESEIETDRAALVAWRVRSHLRTGSGNSGKSRWRTVDGGLAAGEFALREHGRYVPVSEECLPGANEESFDPFSDSRVHLGEPEHDVRLGEPSAITKALERLRLIGKNGLLSDATVSLSIGGTSASPNRYQATVVEAGEELTVGGTVDETQDGPVLKPGGEDTRGVVGGRVDDGGNRLRRRALTQVGLGVVVLATGLYLF
ncbi:hypothetical protein [Natronorubrum daqingense]|uniref:Uncharacterized protein n=1 Tax=Natronorubrum daqingense TaxID=588898 RepID=A0A1N6ZBE4_9EURY|nr:hypothetical protein [Natronorubrum daqingense]APX95402.1 hypothetical protein BB347_01550 [Natronorubrum daqingense]SIR24091.1 hypothetical protein SAMN05421809_0746 [Natronorubrum daqingense]